MTFILKMSNIRRSFSRVTEHYTLLQMELLTTWMLTLLLVFLALIAILGNFLVCLAVKTDKTLRKLSNLFIVSLAIADLLVNDKKLHRTSLDENNLILCQVSLFVMPFAIVNDVTGEWPLGEQACKVWISSDVMCSTASILSLCAISLDKYIRIKDPLQYTQV